MPSTKGWSLESLVSQSSNFHPVVRIPATDEHWQVVMKRYENRGEPLVIEGFQHNPLWPQDMFTVDYFTKHAVSSEITVRNVDKWTDTRMQLSEFVDKCRSIGPNVEEIEQERLYAIDMECPKSWEDWLQEKGVIPSSLNERGSEDMFRHLPESRSVQTLMCYLGIGDTFTPCRKDLCASSGQNLMCYTENNGSSFWFMTKGSSAAQAAQYFHTLGQELDHQNYTLTLRELAKAPFEVYILEQKLGDLVLVPPRSCHQVVNFGGITIATSWSRMTLQGLSTAYHHELPVYRRVCRPEIYRVKSVIHGAITALTKELEALLTPILRRRLGRNSSNTVSPRTDVLVSDLKELLPLFDCILMEEYEPTYRKISSLISDENPITCDFCGGDIFQSFFECRRCTEKGSPGGNHLHICPGCYSEGRSCKCPYMQPMQYRNFQELIDTRSKTERVIRLHEEYRGQTYILPLDPKSATVPPLFRAAFILNKTRKNTKRGAKAPTICKVKKAQHECRLPWVLSCEKCHFGTCFSHILMAYKMHSVEALLIHSSDTSHTAYHRTHLNGAVKYKEDQPSLQIRQEQGSPFVCYSQLIYNAINFWHCEPASPRFVELGWYDYKDQSFEDAVETVVSSSQVTALSEMDVIKETEAPLPTNDGTSGQVGWPRELGPLLQDSDSNNLGAVPQRFPVDRADSSNETEEQIVLTSETSFADSWVSIDSPDDLTDSIVRDNAYPAHGGSYADVYTGILSKNGLTTKVAIKVIRAHTYTAANQWKINKRLSREIRVWSCLQHSNIVPLLGTTMGFGPYIAMVCPWMNEGNLNQYLDGRKAELNLRRRLQILTDIVNGLSYLHAQPIIHGDLTTANVLIDDGKAHLSDFGLSNVKAQIRTNSFMSSTVTGAPRWTAPELYNVGTALQAVPEVTEHCDIYSFGSVALQVISGRIPYEEIPSDMVVMMEKLKGRNPARPAEPLLSDEFWNFIFPCWNLDPILRPKIDELKGVLQNLWDSCSEEALVANIVGAYKPEELMDETEG